MKKAIILGSFIALGMVAFAQTPTKQTPTAKAPAPAQQPVLQVAQPVVEDVVTETAEAKKEKKECSTDEKKACGTKTAGKKSCCSQKSEAKKD